MKFLFWLLALAAAAVAFVVLARVDTGYVVFVWPPWQVQLSMVLFAVVVLGGFAALYGLFRLLSHALSLPAYVRAWRERRRRERSHAALAAALQAYYEGRYARAEKEAAEAFEGGQAAGVAALLAARAAHQLRNFESRDRWLERAESVGESALAARLVSRAELALDERDYSAARDALRSLHGAGPRHIATSRMLLRAERGTGDWDEVLRLSAQLAKRYAIAPALAEEYKVQATVELLRRAATDAPSLERRWRLVPEADRTQPRIAAAAGQQATKLGRARMARDIIEAALEAEWSPQLVALYGQLPEQMDPEMRAEEARARIERAERWLHAHERDGQLLAALGRLCAQAELWGKARSFLEASLSFEEGRAAHLDLARLAERLDQPAEAQRHYRRAAELP
jgi:HemY protein